MNTVGQPLKTKRGLPTVGPRGHVELADSRRDCELLQAFEERGGALIRYEPSKRIALGAPRCGVCGTTLWPNGHCPQGRIEALRNEAT